MARAHSFASSSRPSRRMLLGMTAALAVAVTLAPLVVHAALIDVVGLAFLVAGGSRLALALAEERGLAGLGGTALGVALLAASGAGFWSLPVLFGLYLAVEAGLRLVQAARHRDLRLYSGGIVAAVIALAIHFEAFCGAFAMFGPLAGLELAIGAWFLTSPQAR